MSIFVGRIGYRQRSKIIISNIKKLLQKKKQKNPIISTERNINIYEAEKLVLIYYCSIFFFEKLKLK